MITLVRKKIGEGSGQGSSRDRSFKGKCGGRIFMGSLARRLDRRRQVVRAEDYKASDFVISRRVGVKKKLKVAT
jgi:hypothetical protein